MTKEQNTPSREELLAWAKRRAGSYRKQGTPWAIKQSKMLDAIVGYAAPTDQQPPQDEALREAAEYAREVLDYCFQACLCERYTTKGFEYSEEHPRLNKAGPGARWQTPRDRIRSATGAITEALLALPTPPQGA